MTSLVIATLGMLAAAALDHWRRTPPPRPGI